MLLVENGFQDKIFDEFLLCIGSVIITMRCKISTNIALKDLHNISLNHGYPAIVRICSSIF